MQTQSERGIAILLALMIITALSLVGASLMFLSQSETYASMNYRVMSQTRYAAESGVQKASNFLLDPAFYPTPGSGTDLLTNYDMTKSPVTCVAGCGTINGPIVLSANPGTPSNYPVAAVITNFQNAFNPGTLVLAGGANVANVKLTYNAVATLITMQNFGSFGGVSTTIQTWQIVGDGGTAGKTNVEVMAIVETPKVPTFAYAAFATASGCGALDWHGNGTVKSYDDTGYHGANVPPYQNSDGDVGTNGNLSTVGSTYIYGNLSAPRAGVGSCTAGAVTALSTTGGATVCSADPCTDPNDPIQLPKAISFPNAVTPVLSPLAAFSTNNPNAGDCAQLITGFPTATCTVSGNTITIDNHGTNMSLPQITLGSHAGIVFVAHSPSARYDVNSLVLNGQSTVGVSATSSTERVAINVSGKDTSGTDVSPALDLQGGGFVGITGCAACSAFDATMLQFTYNGTGQIKFAGNSAASATFYAPNGDATLVGTTDFYGSVIGKTVTNAGGANIYYDRKLQTSDWMAGQPMLGTFTWKRF